MLAVPPQIPVVGSSTVVSSHVLNGFALSAQIDEKRPPVVPTSIRSWPGSEQNGCAVHFDFSGAKVLPLAGLG